MLFSSWVRVRIRVRIRFSVLLVISCYAHVFLLLSIVTVTLPINTLGVDNAVRLSYNSYAALLEV